ncbi:Homeobox protein prospero [Camponotus floridanus]|uniref:Homeobox protein prospero n=1 Tax=Camponotus floridanus TaxID=104421 RepID=E2AG40_CAMFO|nr:Homeobox protein prospero [Camponotus floridanus]
MSSEEETECFALYGATTESKQQQLLKKQKRTRQRVDAGEPRNSYSSIPNFSSRPSFLGGGLYGSIFSGRQVKQASDAGGSPPEGGHGMTGAGMDPASNLQPGAVSGGEESGDGNNVVNSANHSDRDTVMPGDAEDSAEDAASAARAMEEAFAEAGMEPGANLDGSDCEQSLPPSPTAPRSGSVSVKEEIQESLNIKRSPSHSPCPIVPKTETNSPTTEIKRARVENIVSTMRSSPALQPATVNGCKKRKLYQPQQQTVHHVIQHSVNDTMMDDDDESEEEEDPTTIRQKREEKDNLKIQLKMLHEQLAEMQQKYMELSSRMEPDTSESGGDAPPSPPPQHQPQPPPRPPRPHPPPYNGLPALPPDHPHAAAAAMGAAAAASSSGPHITGADLEGLADILKTEITSSLTNLIDSIVARFVQQRRFIGKQTEAAQAAAEQLNKDLLMASQMLERKSPRTKVVDRGAPQPPGGPNGPRGPLNGGPPPPQPTGFSQIGSIGGVPHGPHAGPTENNLNQMNQLPSHARPSVGINDERENRDSEQNEALSLVMTPKKKRHKVTDTRITPRTVSRILAQEGNGSQGGSDSPPPPPPPRPYHAPPPMLPVSLPTSVAIPNPSLHESQVFSPYSPFFNPHASHPGQVPPPGPHHLPASPPGGGVELRDSPPLPHPPAMLHPALLAAAQHGSPDYGHLRMDSNDRASDCNSGDITYDGIQPTISFTNTYILRRIEILHIYVLFVHRKMTISLTAVNSSTLTPMHLRKAKLMFFWVRYPSSAVLKMYFPDIKFNKNNTAQLVKWFSNFR